MNTKPNVLNREVTPPGAIADWMKNNTVMNLETITPEVAAIWMKKNEIFYEGVLLKNRAVAKRVGVDFLAREMTEGRWKTTGDAIVFSDKGRLLNGQHRLLAVIKSGVTIQAYVIYGLPDDTYSVMDVGVRRRGCHALDCLGVMNSVTVASVLTLIGLHEQGGLNIEVPHPDTRPATMVKLFEKHPTVIDVVSDWENRFKKMTSCRTACCAMAYIIRKIDHAMADSFFESLADGLCQTDGSPMTHDAPEYVMREFLIRDKGRRHEKVPPHYVMVYLAKTWNAVRLHKKITLLSYRVKGHNAEGFPELF